MVIMKVEKSNKETLLLEDLQIGETAVVIGKIVKNKRNIYPECGELVLCCDFNGNKRIVGLESNVIWFNDADKYVCKKVKCKVIFED